MLALGIDTSNYATSIALVDSDYNSIVLQKKIFLPVKQGEIGIRQQQAVFEHIKNLTDIFSDFKEKGIGAIGVSVKPKDEENSYMPCFLAGKMCAVSIGGALGVPVIECSHQTGHLTSALFDIGDQTLFSQKLLMMHISGGTTDIILARDGHAVKTLGSSLDLFAGQAVDRLGVKLGYSFPAGKYVSQLAAECKEEIKIGKINLKGYDCNLSGLENQCDKMLKDGKSREYVSKYCLYFIAQTAKAMIEKAREHYGPLKVVMAGGVMSSRPIKEKLTGEIKDIVFVKPELSRDNAVGVAVNAYRKVANG